MSQRVGSASAGFGFRSHALAAWLEAGLVALVIAALLPAFAALASRETGARYGDADFTLDGLPTPVSSIACRLYGGWAEAAVRATLCARAERGTVALPNEVPGALADAIAATHRALVAHVARAQAALEPHESGERDDAAVSRADAASVVAAALQPFVSRFALHGDALAGPRPLTCAAERVGAALASPIPDDSTTEAALRANAILLLAAAVDGRPGTAAVVDEAALPVAAGDAGPCAAMSLREALVAGARLMEDARGLATTARKDAAMRALIASADAQWGIASVVGLATLALARTSIPALPGLAVSWLAWAACAWLARVPAPVAIDRTFVLAREGDDLRSAPATFVLVLVALATVALALAALPRMRRRRRTETAASAFAYPGLVGALGVGTLLILDLSAHAHASSRYLALYHQGHVWLAMVVLTTVGFLRQSIGRTLAWTFSIARATLSRALRRYGRAAVAVPLLAGVLVGVVALSLLLANRRQITSELGRLWLILGAAWFFFLRGTPLTERIARGGSVAASLARYASPLVFVVVVLVAAMVLTRDMGPLLIAAYGAGAFLAACIAMWAMQRGGGARFASALAVALFAGWIGLTTSAVFAFGAVDPVTAGRLENAAAPLAANNDQLALVTWFQRAAPADGFGPGNVPWCGYRAAASCAGVPGQVQSDYTFTALVGTFGWTTAWLMALACVAWLHAVVRAHARCTTGEPRLRREGQRLVNDEQGLLSWIALAWVVVALCQLAVTVAGNVGVIPLTGVPFPFVSFGMTSLLLNVGMLGLALNVTPDGASRA